MKKLLPIIISAALLQGCVAGIFAAGGATGTALGQDPRTLQTVADDNQIESQIEKNISDNKDLSDKSHIIVESFNHMILLVGQVPSDDMKQQAEDAAKKVDGVKRVFNQLTVGDPTSLMQRSKDATITTNVRTRMLTTTNLKSNEFKIVTEDATVYLMGQSTRQQADIATAVIRNSTGVQRVVKLVQYVQVADDN